MNSNNFKIAIPLLIELAIPFSILLAALIWSATLFSGWGSDFGFYYATSYFLSDEHLIYKDAFTHKGPLYFILIKSIGEIIGWGGMQSYVSLVVTVLCFYFPIIYIINKKAYKNTNKFIVVFISIALLYRQNTNLSMSLFQSGILIMSFYFLLEALRNTSVKTYGLSVVFFSLALLVRIDAAVYSPIFLVALIFMYQKGLKFRCISQMAMVGVIGLILPFLACSYYLGFSLQDYLIHNVDFNRYYKVAGWLIYRPVHFSILMYSGIAFFFVYLIVRLPVEVQSLPLKNKIKKFNVDRAQYWLAILLIVLGFILWMVSSSDKDYHVFFIATPLVFFISFWGGMKDISTKIFLFTFPLLLYVVSLSVNTGWKLLVNHPQCIDNIICQASGQYYRYIKPIKNMKNNEYTEIIGGNGWVYFFSDTQPKRPINDWYLYYKKIPFTTKALLNAHNVLINQPTGYEFGIAKTLLNGEERSKYFKQILTISSPVGDEGAYVRYKIK